MPGLVMEHGNPQQHNGQTTDHDTVHNGGVNGDAGSAGPMVNGGPAALPMRTRMNDLPDEIQQATEDFIPLGLMMARLSQLTHNQLQAKVLELAKIAVRPTAVNGHGANVPDDDSPENRHKKLELLNFITALHGKWTKALIIGTWSKNIIPISKLFDLKEHLATVHMTYQGALDFFANVKRDLVYSTVPNPDLATALQVLSTGDAPWMPDLGYIEPPPMSPKEQMQWIEELNTLLALRLNLEDHDKIPHHFRNYTIASGRVTFKVQGEFEIDLTIADEDFEKQFWFIDFRFAFEPAPVELTDILRLYVEAGVNEAIEKDGLMGCYKYLHELVLTHKITEYVRQASELARGRWVDAIRVERLNRAMAITYWTSRYGPDSPKSWIILGVHSGRKPGSDDPKSTSRLALRWFKEGKEVKDVDTPWEQADVSAEHLLHSVIAKHVELVLSSMHRQLCAKGRFMRREAALRLQISSSDPTGSTLSMQLSRHEDVTIRIAPTSGVFLLSPQNALIMNAEARLNYSKDPIADGPSVMEKLIWYHMVEEIRRRGMSVGWALTGQTAKYDDVKRLLRTKEPFNYTFLKKQGWPPSWFLMLVMSLNGDQWWLVELSQTPTGHKISTAETLPLSVGAPDLTDSFFAKLGTFGAIIISHIMDQKAMLQRRVRHFAVGGSNRLISRGLKVPMLVLKLSDILPPRHRSTGRGASWARDAVTIMFKRLRKPLRRRKTPTKIDVSGPQGNQAPGTAPAGHGSVAVELDARFRVTEPSKFSLLKGNVERDVAFNPRKGIFALRLEVKLGTTFLDALAHRLQAIERLVNCVEAIGSSSTDIKCETITLTEVAFTYSDAVGDADPTTSRRWKATLDLQHDKITMKLEKGNPHLRSLYVINNMLNSELGFVKVPQYLRFTLPVLKALDAMDETWREMEKSNVGRLEIFPDHLDWFNIRYTLPGGDSKSGPRRLTLQAKLRERRGEFWWFVERREPKGSAPDAELAAVLSQVFEVRDRSWQSFVRSAAARMEDVGSLLQAVDKAMRSLAMKRAGPSPSMVKRGVAAGKQRPQQQQQGNQQQQQRIQQQQLGNQQQQLGNQQQQQRPQQQQLGNQQQQQRPQQQQQQGIQQQQQRTQQQQQGNQQQQQRLQQQQQQQQQGQHQQQGNSVVVLD